MTRQYLNELTPEEVTDRLNKGERVYYEDTKGNKYSYQYINGICVRFDECGDVDGYGRSIYSTGEAYFDSYEEVCYETEDDKLKKYIKLVVEALKEGLDK